MYVLRNGRGRARGTLPLLGGWLTMLLAAAPAALSFAADEEPAPLAAFEIVDENSVPTPLTESPGDAVNGRKVMGDRKLGNCLACHQVTDMDDLPYHGDIAPTLDGVADRYSEGELRLLVVNPKEMFPDTLMPAFYRVEGLHRVMKEFEGKPILTAQQVEDVVAYLGTLHEAE